jgi:tripartite-type tricarboxylate transporter receptor subunit TctC
MKASRPLLFAVLVAIGIAVFGPSVSFSQQYPNRPIQLVIPLVAGSAMDLNGRLLAEELGRMMKVQIVPVNKPGASLILGTDTVAKSKKDGYTFAYTGSAAIIYGRILDPGVVPYDPFKDLEPLGLHCFTPLVGVVKEDSPWKNFGEMIDFAKKNPGKIRVGTYGQGSVDHFNLEIIQSVTGAEFTHIPFKGGQSVITAVLGGHVEVVFYALGQVMPYVGDKKMKVLVITKKIPEYPEFPTLQDLGYKQDLLSAWFAMYGPNGMPEDVRKTLTTAIEKAVKNKELKAKIEKLGFAVDYRSPAELKKLMTEEYEKTLAIAIKIGLRK